MMQAVLLIVSIIAFVAFLLAALALDRIDRIDTLRRDVYVTASGQGTRWKQCPVCDAWAAHTTGCNACKVTWCVDGTNVQRGPFR